MASSMYFIFGLLLVGIFQSSALTVERIKKMGAILHRDCVIKIGVDEAMIAACVNGNMPEDPKLKCYMRCMMVAGLIMKKGVIDTKLAASMVPEEHRDHVIPIINACGTVTGVDECDTAWQTNRCWQSHDPDNYYLM